MIADLFTSLAITAVAANVLTVVFLLFTYRSDNRATTTDRSKS